MLSSPFSFVDVERDYLNLRRRHPKLYISEDFTLLRAHWTSLSQAQLDVNLDHLVPVHCDFDKDKLEKKPEHHVLSPDSFAPNTHTVFTARVMVLCGALDTQPSAHLSQGLKFLVGKEERSELVALGGPWSKEKDGGDPATEPDVLIRTAKYVGL